MALPAIAVLVAAGLAQAWFHLGSVGALFTTTYGLALLAKVSLVAGIIGLASGNRRRVARLTSSGASTPPPALRRAMRAEVLLAVLVLAATATLVRAAPPAASDSGPVVRELDVGPMRLQIDIEPAKVGPNDYHVYLFNRRTGAQVDVKQVTLRLRQRDEDIGPFTLDIPRKGPAHHERLGPPLGVPGEWEAQIDVRISKFDQFTARTKFNVR